MIDPELSPHRNITGNVTLREFFRHNSITGTSSTEKRFRENLCSIHTVWNTQLIRSIKLRFILSYGLLLLCGVGSCQLICDLFYSKYFSNDSGAFSFPLSFAMPQFPPRTCEPLAWILVSQFFFHCDLGSSRECGSSKILHSGCYLHSIRNFICGIFVNKCDEVSRNINYLKF